MKKFSISSLSLSLHISTFLFLLLITGGVFFSGVNEASADTFSDAGPGACGSSHTVTMNKSTYAPGETITLTGDGRYEIAGVAPIITTTEVAVRATNVPTGENHVFHDYSVNFTAPSTPGTYNMNLLGWTEIIWAETVGGSCYTSGTHTMTYTVANPTPPDPAITGVCSRNPSSPSVVTGTSVTWSVSAGGGNGTYGYSWSGTDSLSGSGSSAAITYGTAGTKTGSVTVSSGSQSATFVCSSVTVTDPATPAGQCGSAHGVTTSSPPSSNLCSVGSASSVATNTSTYNWTCSGSPSANCSAPRTVPTNGDCGSANGVPASTPHPGSGLCDAGSASAVNSSGSNHTWTCSGSNGGSNASCSAPKSAVPSCSVDIQGNGSNGPLAVNQGSNLALSWTTSNAVSCTGSGAGWSSNPKSASGGSNNITVNQSSLYSISCLNSAGNTCSDSVSVSMNAAQPAPAVDIRANGSNGPITASAGSLVNISWNSSDTTSCTASASPSSSTWTGAKNTAGSQSWTMPSSSTVLTIQCTGPGGVASDSVTVNANTTAGQCGPAAGVPTLSPPSGPTKCSPVGSPQSSVQLLGSPGNQYYQWTCFGSPNTTCTAPYGSPPPSADLKVNGSDGPVTVPSGSNLSLSWLVMDTAECYLYGAGISPYPRLVGNTSGSHTIYGATTSSSYSIGCHSADYGSWIEDSVSVTIDGFLPPAITLTVNGSSSNPVTVGQSGATAMNMAWSTTNATSCTVTQGTGWSGAKAVPSGSETIPVAVSSYTLQCTGPGGISSVTRNTQLPSTLKICEDSCNNGGFNPSGYTMQIGSTKNLVACYNSSSTCDNSSGNVTSSATWTQGGGNPISVSGTNPRVLRADNQGNETIRASYSGDNVTKNVQVVSCLPSVDASNCSNDTCGEIQVDNGCGAMITCPVSRACDYNWKEVTP